MRTAAWGGCTSIFWFTPVLGMSPAILAVSPAGPFRRKAQTPGESKLARFLLASNFPGPVRIPSPGGDDLPG